MASRPSKKRTHANVKNVHTRSARITHDDDLLDRMALLAKNYFECAARAADERKSGSLLAAFELQALADHCRQLLEEKGFAPHLVDGEAKAIPQSEEKAQ